MVIVTFEGLCGFAENGKQWDVHFAGMGHLHAHPEAHAHHPILLSRSLDFRWPTDEAGAAATLMPDELVTIGNEQFALWHLKGHLTAKAQDSATTFTTSRTTMIDLGAEHPASRIKSTRSTGCTLTLAGGLLHASSMRPETLILFRKDASGAIVGPEMPGVFAQTVEWSSMAQDVTRPTVVFYAPDGRTMTFAQNARLSVTNSAPDFDAIKHDHFGGYYDLITLAAGDSRLFLDHAAGVRFGGEAGNCPPGVILPS